MTDTLKYKGYYGSVEFSREDGILFGKLLFLNKVLVTYEGLTITDLAKAFEDGVDSYLDSCDQNNIVPQKPFKGSFNIRPGESRHELMAIAVQEHDLKSLNEFVNQAIDRELVRLGR